VLLVVVGKHVPHLEFLSVLLGDEPVFDPPTRYYQRLLASDQEEAGELVEEFAGEMPLESIYEQVLIPALALAHRDLYRGKIDADRMAFIRDTMKDEVQDLADSPPPEPGADAAAETPATATATATSNIATSGQAPAADAPKIVQRSRIPGSENVRILCLPARDESDEVAGMMFAQVLERAGYKSEAVSVTALASEMIELVEQKKADIVIISALPPSAVTHARYLCKRLHLKFPEIKLVIGLWTSKADMERARRRMTCNKTDVVVNDFSSAVHEVEQIVHPLLLTKTEQNAPKKDEKVPEPQTAGV
jgi:hypothetical protein